MNVNTKFNVGDRVYFFYNNAIESRIIREIHILVVKINTDKAPDTVSLKELYCLEGISDELGAGKLYRSVDDLLKGVKDEFSLRRKRA